MKESEEEAGKENGEEPERAHGKEQALECAVQQEWEPEPESERDRDEQEPAQ